MKTSFTLHTIFLLTTFSISTIQAATATQSTLYNTTAYIPSQCYTKTETETETETNNKKIQNPCYVCHTKSVQPNYINDQDLQLTYSFPEAAQTNPWHNLFEDRTERIASISDQSILSYIRTSNYFNEDGSITLAQKLQHPPTNWDYNNNNRWDGYRPDCYFSFDNEGFDRSSTGTPSGWRAFGYTPLPATFWPTNGSTDDVMIRLPQAYRQNSDGKMDLQTYKINLAIVEALITRRDVIIDTVDESKWNADLDNDGKIDTANHICFHWPDTRNNPMTYVGLASQKAANSPAAGLFPLGTEFLHSVRYLDITGEKDVALSPRMKELRYMKKRTWQTYSDLEESALSEMKERADFPDRVTQFIGNAEQGVNNGSGWVLQGFIEDHSGALRPQTYEETVYCAGCHGGIGITTDSVFAFPRKIAATEPQKGWFHWNKTYLTDTKEPKIKLHKAGVFYEYSYYLMYNSSGSDLRNNSEIRKKFTNLDNSIDYKELLTIQNDISHLLIPSHKRALELNKAYRTIVVDQDFRHGRDTNIKPLTSVLKTIEPDQPTGVTTPSSPLFFTNSFGPDKQDHTQMPHGQQRQKEIFGHSMPGPDGLSYGAHLDGSIAKSSYHNGSKDIKMLFPNRLTLPTRQIIPTDGNPNCGVCHRDVSGSSDALVQDFTNDETSTVMTITSKGNNHSAHFSPDGKHIAYVSNQSGMNQIWVMESNGKEKKQLTFGTERHDWPNWSSDSLSLVYIGRSGTTAYSIKSYDFIHNKEITEVTSTQKLARPVFHPDVHHKIIAYGGITGKNWDVWLLDEQKQKIRLTYSPDMESNPLWSPDGTMLAYKVAPADAQYGLTIENFLSFEGGYHHPTVHVWQGVESVQMNAWSPDGKKIAYTAEVINGASGEEKVTYSAIVSDLTLSQNSANVEGSNIISRGFTLGDRGPLFSPDGTKIIFWGWNKDLHAGLWLYNMKTDKTSQITTPGDAMYPQWNPDSNSLLFEARIGDNTQLITMMLPTISSDKATSLAVH